MPGTVQVSILELIELPSSKSSSTKSIKVSLGKNTYEAEGQKGDFLFPLATFRDNLVVKVHDNKGNEIAHTGVKSRLIAEKGYWDDEFPLEGGGQIHMKLKFSLSEDERNRIRNMRESALRKKKEELLNRKMITAAASSGGGNEIPAAIDLPLVSFKSSSIPVKNTSSFSLNEKIPGKKTDKQHYNLKEQILLEKKPATELKQDDRLYELKEQSPLEKIPSGVIEDGKPLNLKDHQPYVLDEQNLIKDKPLKLEDDDQPYKLKESKKEETPSKLQEDNQPYGMKDQSACKETPRKLQEDDQPCNVKDQSELKEKPSELQEDNQPYGVKDQSPLKETPSIPQEGDQPNRMKEQSEMEETPRELQKPGNLKDETPLEKIHSELQEEDQPGNLKDESPMEKTQLQEDDQPYNMKEETSLENRVSKLQEIDQNKCTEQSPLEETPSKVKDEDQLHNLKKPTQLEATPSKVNKDDQRYKYNIEEQNPLEATPSKVKDSDQGNILKKPTPLEAKPSKVEENERRYKNPVEKTSSRIWETIAAFESSTLTKERTNTAKAQSSREQPTSILAETLPIQTKYVDNVEYKSKEVLVEKLPKEKYPLHNTDEPSDMEQYKIQPSISVKEQDYASDRRGLCSCNNFQGWIFLEEAVCTCIVSDNRMVIDSYEDHNVDPETYPGQVDEEVTSSEDNELPDIAKKPDSGPNGQIMKIVIMVGFGLLVLFTRSKKSR